MPKRSRKRDLDLSMPGPQTRGKGKSPRKSAKSSESSDTAGKAGIEIPASETPFAIKDSVLQELIGLGRLKL